MADMDTANESTDPQGQTMTADTQPAQPTPGAVPASKIESILADLRPIAKFKARSHDTSKNVHIPLLQSHIKDAPKKGPQVVLLGDSMFERMTTTGETPNFVAPWPSPAMLSDEILCYEESDYKRIDGVFNAGVGGDKIQNLIYRLVGASHPKDEEKDLPGLLPMLAACGTVKLWVIHIGTNNLHPKHGLQDDDVEALRKLVEALAKLNSEGTPSQVTISLLWPRKDISEDLVYRANLKLKGMAKVFKDRAFKGETHLINVEYREVPTRDFNIEEHLDDHVHLNLEGYRVWMQCFYFDVLGGLRG
jgi:platelet-activating factor acetylhydrolase IB subunit beta/gamma